MFEQEIELVKKHLLEQLFSSQQYIYIHEILNNPALDDAYKTFFSAEVDWWIYEEQSLRQSNPRFDIDAPEIRQSLQDLDARYRNVARFDHEELAATVDAAAKARLNFLVRPRTALKWFVFRGEPTKPLNEILLRLAFFSDHQYLTNGFKEWSKQRRIDRQPMEILSVVEFERIIERIDNEAIFDLSPQQFVDLLAPVFDYFQAPSSRIPAGTIPTEALIIFLDDKGVVPISQTLENLLYNEELRFIAKERFLEIVDSIVQEMDDEQNIVQDATLPLEFDTVLPVKEIGGNFNSVIPEITDEVPAVKPAENNEEENNEEVSSNPDADITEDEFVQADSSNDNGTVDDYVESANKDEIKKIAEEPEEVLKGANIEKEDIESPELRETEFNEYVIKEEPKENSYAGAATKENTEGDEVEPESSSDGLESFIKGTYEADRSSGEDAAAPISHLLKNSDTFDSFLEDIHRFKSSDAIIGFDGSLSEEIIEQTIFHDSFNGGEISETEKHEQELRKNLPSISQFIDAKHIEKFTRKLFNRNDVEYVRFLNELEKIPHWKEAARRIDLHLAQNDIEPDSSVAEEFRELVHRRYGK